MDKFVHCPLCLKKYGEKKILLKLTKTARGEVIVRCRRCKTDIRIDLEKAQETA